MSFLRSHPDTKYVIQSTDSLFTGLPAALKAAGLNDVKIFGEGPGYANLKNIATGDQAGSMAFAFYEIMFGAVDAIARQVRRRRRRSRASRRRTGSCTKDNLPELDRVLPGRAGHPRQVQADVGQVLIGLA